jgi:hypothetical protein
LTITEADWQQLRADQHAHGITVRRVYPHSARELFIAIRHPDGLRMLTLGVDADGAAEVLRRLQSLPRTRGLDVQFARSGDSKGELRFTLTDDNLREVFNPLASDIAATAQTQATEADAALAAFTRFEHWRQMLQSLADKGMSPEARRGLFGELTVLRDYVLAALPGPEAVRAWTGPTAANQDFQTADIAIEVKTSAGKEPQTLVISNERELDGTGVTLLLLAHLSLDERRGGNGESLNALISATRAAISDPAAMMLLDDLLVRAGYLQQQRELYDEPRYAVRKQRFWRVVAEFPRIVESDLRPGVGDCSYRISTAGLEPFAYSSDAVTAALTGGIGHE